MGLDAGSKSSGSACNWNDIVSQKVQPQERDYCARGPAPVQAGMAAEIGCTERNALEALCR